MVSGVKSEEMLEKGKKETESEVLRMRHSGGGVPQWQAEITNGKGPTVPFLYGYLEWEKWCRIKENSRVELHGRLF